MSEPVKLTSNTMQPLPQGSDTTSSLAKETFATPNTYTRDQVLRPGILANPVGADRSPNMVVKIGHQRYEVVDTLTEEAENRCGVTYKQLGLIKLNPNLAPDVRRDTILHEVLHGVCAFAGISPDDALTEEEWIGRTTPTLLTVLQENKRLLKALELYAD